MRYEAARLRKAHDDLLATYEAKLAKLGVPKEELGFKYVFLLTAPSSSYYKNNKAKTSATAPSTFTIENNEVLATSFPEHHASCMKVL